MPYREEKVGRATLVLADAIQWLERAEENSVHAVVTDPPYGVKEFELEEVTRMKGNGGTGVWRLPPTFDGCTRAPVPRFTDLRPKDIAKLEKFFTHWAELTLRVLRPGGHVFLATNTFMARVVYSAIVAGGLEYRGQFIRLVQTLRGGDKPKLSEKEFPEVSTLPKGKHEPWGIFRKPIPKGMRVSECLREYGTGGFRNLPDGKPFPDVAEFGRTKKSEKIGNIHPTQKPIDLMRFLVRGSLPLGEGVVLDTFSGSGTTLAAANLEDYDSIGLEWNEEFFDASLGLIPELVRQAEPNLSLL